MISNYRLQHDLINQLEKRVKEAFREMDEKMAYSCQWPEDRENILKKVQERVLNEHLIIHRMNQRVKKLPEHMAKFLES